MVDLQLLSGVMALCLEQLFQTRYGAPGVLCLLLVGAGFRARDTTCLSAGAVLFVLLMMQA